MLSMVNAVRAFTPGPIGSYRKAHPMDRVRSPESHPGESTSSDGRKAWVEPELTVADADTAEAVPGGIGADNFYYS